MPVPPLTDPERGLVLRGHRDADLPRLIEEARDPQTRAWTNVPTPDDGFGPAQARAFLDAVGAGWANRSALSWAVVRDDGPYLGTVNLRVPGAGRSDLSYVLHPDARGRGTMSAAVRLVLRYAFEVAEVQVVTWEAYAGHRDSLRVAEAVGFRREGTRRLGAEHHGRLRDVWTASLLRDDPRPG